MSHKILENETKASNTGKVGEGSYCSLIYEMKTNETGALIRETERGFPFLRFRKFHNLY